MGPVSSTSSGRFTFEQDDMLTVFSKPLKGTRGRFQVCDNSTKNPGDLRSGRDGGTSWWNGWGYETIGLCS